MIYIEKTQPIITAIPINLMELGPLRAMLFNDGNDLTTYFTMRDGDLYLNLLDGTFQPINNGDYVYKLKIHEGTENEQYVYATMPSHLFLEKYKLLSTIVSENITNVENSYLANKIAGLVDEQGNPVTIVENVVIEPEINEIPNSALADRIAGLVDEQGNRISPIIEENDIEETETNEPNSEPPLETDSNEPFYPTNDL